MAATQEEIVDGLAEIVNEIAGIPVEDVQLDKSFTDDLDVDSLSMVEVVVAAEERFDVKIPDEDVKNLKTVGDAADYILEAPGLTFRPRLRCSPPGGGAADSRPLYTWRKNSCELDQSHRGRHRYRRNHTAGWRHRLDLGGSAGGPLRRQPLEGERFAELPVRIAAPAAVDPGEVLPRPLARKLDRSAQFALIAAKEAWADAGFTARAGEDVRPSTPDRLGTVIASGIGGVTTLLDQYDVLQGEGRTPRLPAHRAHAHAERPVGQRRPGGQRPRRACTPRSPRAPRAPRPSATPSR